MQAQCGEERTGSETDLFFHDKAGAKFFNAIGDPASADS
jgi:hypothetical protein